MAVFLHFKRKQLKLEIFTLCVTCVFELSKTSYFSGVYVILG